MEEVISLTLNEVIALATVAWLSVVRTEFAITEPVPDINDSTVTCTETNGFNSISLPKEVEKLKEIVDDINNISPYYVITTT